MDYMQSTQPLEERQAIWTLSLGANQDQCRGSMSQACAEQAQAEQAIGTVILVGINHVSSHKYCANELIFDFFKALESAHLALKLILLAFLISVVVDIKYNSNSIYYSRLI